MFGVFRVREILYGVFKSGMAGQPFLLSKCECNLTIVDIFFRASSNMNTCLVSGSVKNEPFISVCSVNAVFKRFYIESIREKGIFRFTIIMRNIVNFISH